MLICVNSWLRFLGALGVFFLPLPLLLSPASSLKPQEFRAPRERQALAASLYSGAMMLPPPYCPVSAPATGFGAAIIRQGDFRLSSGEALKKTNSVCVLSNFALGSAPPFAPGSSLFSLLCALSVLCGEALPCQLPTDYYSPDISRELPLCRALILQSWRCSLTVVSLDGLSMEGL